MESKARDSVSAEIFSQPKHIEGNYLDTLFPQDCYQVLSADSSQQTAIEYSKNNVSFVMQGPPGTGKSQTIANIIGEAMAQDKKILFVAEKATALQVVLQRLKEVHLSNFCLSLHSSDGKKREVLDELHHNLLLAQTTVKDTALNQLNQLSFLRDELNRYVAQLHLPTTALQQSVYEVQGKLAPLIHLPALSFSIDSIEKITPVQLQTHLNSLQNLEQSISALLGNVLDNPWKGLNATSANFEYTEMMKKSLLEVLGQLDSVASLLEELTECPDSVESLEVSQLPILKIVYTKQALKDKDKLTKAKLSPQAKS